MNRLRVFWFWPLCLLSALGLRLWLLPEAGFYGDVPRQIRAVDSGGMLIQFPGYVPYHLLISRLVPLTGGVWEAFRGLSLLAGMLSLGYVSAAARSLGGPRAGKWTGAFMACSLWPVYFSVVGSSYALDLLCVSGMLFHGLRALQTHAPRGHFAAVLVWFGFGLLMRPMSMLWTAPGILFLAWQARSWMRLAAGAAAVAVAVSLLLLLTLPYVPSARAYWESAVQIENELSAGGWKPLATNLLRLGLYPLYGLHLWWACGSWRRLRAQEVFSRPELGFALCLVGGYALLLIRYLPHAGYLCLLLPVLAVAPWLLRSDLSDSLSPRGFRLRLAALVALSLLQWMLPRPLHPGGLPAAVANAYVLQYSRAGLRTLRFETLSSELQRAGGTDWEKVPPARREALRRWQELNSPEE